MKTHRKKTPARTQRSTKRLRILVPIDFSAGADRALQRAVDCARKDHSRVILLHVVQMPYLGIGFDAREVFALENKLVVETRAQLAEVARGLRRQGLEVDEMVRTGRAVQGIAETAERTGSDLIVIGSRGQTGLKKIMLGSVAEGVVRHAPCPVLVVPKEK